MLVLNTTVGENITRVADRLVIAVKASPDQKARVNFNGITVVARRASTPSTLVSQFHKKLTAKARRASRTDRAKAQASKWAVYETSVQQKHDQLMLQLPGLDFTDISVVLDWIYEFQNSSDFIPVTNKDPLAVLDIFAQHGFYPLGKAEQSFDKKDKISLGQQIIRQALAGLACEVGAIHQVICYWIEDWRKQFITVH